MKELFFFDKMVTPKIITFVFWLLLVVAVFMGLGAIFGNPGGTTFMNFISGIFLIVAGSIFARIWCELLIVLFRMTRPCRRFAINSDSQPHLGNTPGGRSGPWQQVA